MLDRTRRTIRHRGAPRPPGRARVPLLVIAGVLSGALGAGAGCRRGAPGEAAVSATSAGPAAPGEGPRRRAELRALYSGHSLTDGVPEAIALIAGSLGDRFDYQVQSIEGSLLRQRTKGDDPSAAGWPGYRQGRNRAGAGLDVAAELRGSGPRGDAALPATAAAGPYDVLVVTERHDLPYAVWAEATAAHLRHMHDRLIEGNPAGQTLLYHAWLEIDRSAPEAWIDYERRAAALWSCVAAKVNLTLEADGRRDRIGRAPGGAALAALVARAARGELAGLAGATTAERLGAFFRDDVHLTAAGTYFLGAVHYGLFFGRSAEGAALPAGLVPALGTELQRLAWAEARAFHAAEASAAPPTMEACRAVAAGLCRPFHAIHFANVSLVGRLKREKNVFSCQRLFEDAADARNPFRWPDPTFPRWPAP